MSVFQALCLFHWIDTCQLFDFTCTCYTAVSNSMEQSRSWEADSLSDSREISRLAWIRKVHYPVNNSLPLVLILSQMTPVYTFALCFSKIHSNIILPYSEFFSTPLLPDRPWGPSNGYRGSFLGVKWRGVRRLHLVLRLRMCGAIPPLTQYVFMAWCLIEQYICLYAMVLNQA